MIEIRGDKKVLDTPVSKEDLADIKIGDIVWLDGDLMTCRDVAHRRLVEYGRELPYDIRNKAIFHAGPILISARSSLLTGVTNTFLSPLISIIFLFSFFTKYLHSFHVSPIIHLERKAVTFYSNFQVECVSQTTFRSLSITM